MRRTVIRLLLVTALAGGILQAGGGGEAAASRPALTVKAAKLGVQSGRLTYSLEICTRVKSVLRIRATFKPLSGSGGARTITPGATQYQSAGCWPAFVSAPVARSVRSCAPLRCPALAGHRYTVTVRIIDEHPSVTAQGPRKQAVA